jgi:UDP-N-acetylglucosamine:LPS N-acetylglucosamine transferase
MNAVYRKICSQFDWDQSVFEHHPEFFDFLNRSGLLYSIRGYQHSYRLSESNAPESEPFRIGIRLENGHPMIFSEGAWLRWDALKEKIEYDAEKNCLVSKNNPAQKWNYTYPAGLTAAANFITYQLTAEEMGQLKSFCQSGEPQKCVIQIVSTDDAKIFNRVGEIGLRLINERGEVHSFGGSEFRPFHERRVTSIPATSEQFHAVLSKVEEYLQSPQPHSLHKNSTTLIAGALRELNIQVDHTCYLTAYVWELLKDVPVIGLLARTIEEIALAVFSALRSITPNFIEKPTLWLFDKIFYIPRKILAVLRNILLLIAGARHLTWRDLLKEEVGLIHSSMEIVKWQTEQMRAATYHHPYTGSPRLAIVPPERARPVQAPLPKKSCCTPLDVAVAIITALWRAFLFGCKRLFRSIGKLFSCLTTEQKAALHQLGERIEQKPSQIERMFFQELKEKVADLPRSESAADFFAKIDATSEKMEALAQKAEEGAAKIQHLYEADALYRECMAELKQLKELPSVPVQIALITGQLTSIFRELDDTLSEKLGEPLHRYCGCHIKSKEDPELKSLSPTIRDPKFLVEHPAKQEAGELPKRTSAVLLSQSYGGGHNVVQHAMSQRLAERGGHAYKVEADEEVLEAYYGYRDWTGKSGAEWSQFLLQHNGFRLIRLLGWLSSKRDTLETREEKIDMFARSMLARGQQDLAVMCWGRNTSPAEKAAGRLGMGLLEIATDLDYEVFDFEKDVENPHYRHGLMAKDAEREKEILGKVLESHQIVETGFPVRDPFLKQYSENELAQIRQMYRQKYGLAPDARVVVFMCGGEGVSNTMAETLLDQYPADAPKIHLFAICGNNKEKKMQLEDHIYKIKKGNIQATALGRTEAKELGELFAMAALEKEKGLLISAKAGGGTTSEGIARGTPMLISEMGGLKHEIKNLNFVTEKKLGQSFQEESQLPEKVVQMLQTPFEPHLSPSGESYSNFNSQAKSIRVIRDITEQSRQDSVFQERRALLRARAPLASAIPAAPSPRANALPAFAPAG